MTIHLCWDYGQRDEEQGMFGLVESELAFPKSVVIYLSHPSDSNSYTLRCLYILTLGLQGHNLKRYPVKNVEKYKIKN